MSNAGWEIAVVLWFIGMCRCAVFDAVNGEGRFKPRMRWAFWLVGDISYIIDNWATWRINVTLWFRGYWFEHEGHRAVSRRTPPPAPLRREKPPCNAPASIAGVLSTGDITDAARRVC